MKPVHISFGQHCLETRQWEEKENLLRHLESCSGGHLLLGAGSDRTSEFYSVTLMAAGAGAGQSGIGILSEGHGLVPHLLLRPARQLLAVGFNEEVSVLQMPDCSIRFSHALDSLFSQFLSTESEEVLVVLHEIGVDALTWDGEELWSFSKDVIVDWWLTGDSLHLEFMDSPAVDLSLKTGRLEE